MKIYKSIDEFHKVENGLCLAIGTFDGFHSGHLSVIEKTIEIGRRNKCKTGILAFENIPKNLIKKEKHYNILTNSDRLELAKTLGVDVFILLKFTDEIKNTTREDFLKILVNDMNVLHIVVGENFKFGKGALGTSAWLQNVSKEYGISVEICPDFKDEEDVVSSTRIRKHLKLGEIKKANKLLGRIYSVSGIVQHGFENGRNIGFPTANIDTNGEIELLKNGVYATKTSVCGKLYNSITNVGYNPTFNGDVLKLETYIFNFDSDIYDERIRVYFYEMIREEKKFSSIKELVSQIKKDTTKAKKILEEKY